MPPDPVTADSISTTPTSAPIKFVILQAKGSLIASGDSDGVVKTWGTSTGYFRGSFHMPTKGSSQGGTYLIDGSGSTFVWWADQEIHIWDAERHETLHIIDTPGYDIVNIKISGDESMVFCLDKTSIQAWSMSTGDAVGKVKLEGKILPNSFIVDGSRVRVRFEDFQVHGWDFGITGSSPIPLSSMSLLSLPRYHLDFINCIGVQDSGSSRIEDMATREEVFRLSGRYAKPTAAQWDGRYLVAGYDSGEVLILDFKCMIPQ